MSDVSNNGGAKKPKPSKLKPNVVPMPEQDAKVRAGNFDEVPTGYTMEMAQEEASRCLQCKNEPCRPGCPVEVPIKDFIRLLGEGDPIAAANKIKETNNLAAICGRVCPQEEQCQAPCVIGKKGDPVSIGALERFVADYQREHGDEDAPIELPEPTGKKVAIIGAGPAGLTAAADLAMIGHSVTVYEALHAPGGVLAYGIPRFRLPQAVVDAEVEMIKKLGVNIEYNAVIGKLFTIDELVDELGFDACFIGTGAGLPAFANIPGENLNGVYSANELLTRVNLMKAYQFPEFDTPIKPHNKVVVLGAGNTAMDCARTSLRLGADVTLVYRRSEAEMTARIDELHHAKEEGVDFQLLTNPVEVIGEDGWVKAVKVQRMELGEPDDSGRRRPVPIPDSEYEIEADAFVVAIGTSVNPLVPNSTKNLDLNKWGYILADPATGATSKPGVYAGGDIVTGAATVITAMGAGKDAAVAINRYLGGPEPEVTEPEEEVVTA